MRFGLVGFPLGQMERTVDADPAQAVRRIALAADDAGFDFVCAQDHTLAPREWAEERGAGVTWYEPFTTLAWVAAVTTRVRLLTDVVVLPTRSPFVVAKAAATLDRLSGGRLILGVAAGYLEREFRILGAPFEDRGAWTDEAIEVIKACWTTDWVDFEGDHFAAKDVAVSPRPAQEPRPPIWVGGNSRRALRRAVEHADGWTPFRGDPEGIRADLAWARDRCGLDRPFAVAVPLRHGVYADDGSIDARSVLGQAEAFADAGVTHLKVGFRGPSLDGFVRAMEEFGETVIGRL